MSDFEKLINVLRDAYSGAESGGFQFDQVDSVLAINVTGTDVHRSLRGEKSNKDQIDLTYGETLPVGYSPVDDFFPTVKKPLSLPQHRHLKVGCRIWGECLPGSDPNWVDDSIDVVRLPRNGGRNWSLQLRGVDLLRREIRDGSWLIFVHRQRAVEYEVFSLPGAGWSNPSRRSKEVLFRDTPQGGTRIDYTFSEVDVTDGMNLVSSHFKNSLLSRSLLAKSFLILTGPSGTGKTRSAIQFSEGICHPDCMAIVAVGADWTDNRHVVGYLNPLQTKGGGEASIPIYEATEILNLLLHANEHPELPHVLILDEMNLSHVERYFSDFLSAMELKNKKKAVKLHSATLAKTREDAEVEGSIDFPENLFVIGTVNIDETTYMFSPKVLDRANVVEIHVDPTELGLFLKGANGGNEAEARDQEVSFLEAAHAIQKGAPHSIVPDLPDSIRNLAADRLLELFRIMKRGRGEFGFRTGREVLAYLRATHFLTAEAGRASWSAPEGGWIEALDEQVLQKILPKLHGSRTRLSPLLGALATYCATLDENEAIKHFGVGSSAPQRSLSDARKFESGKLDQSFQKLRRMIDVLVDEQFVSFIC